MLQIVKQEWNFEAGSVFLYDTRAKCLRLAATTGLNVVGLQKRYIYYRLTETDHQTVRSFVNQEQLTINEALIGETPPKYREKVRGIYHSALATPFFAPEIPRRHDERAITRCLGVLRLVNRQIIHGHHVEIAEFTWEDIEVVNFLVDVIGVVTHLYQRVAQKAADFERVVHGLETSILTVIGALHNINDNVDTKALFPLFLAHTIPDTISFAESIHEQIRVFKMRDIQQLEAAKFTNVKLVADVVMKIPDFAKNSAKFFGVDDVTVDRNSFFQSASDARQSGERIQPVPSVYADPNLLLFVLKNLIENAIKYSRAGSRCFIKLSWTADAEFVSIYVSDSGIGVPPEDEAFIFYETYQAENAMRRRTQGTGIGLYQCRLIMEKLGGSISYRRDRDHPDGLVTTFVVRIPRKGLRR
jgi:signal transduction histidine kinase